ncbi:hypothetical protein HGO53_02740 [Wolbachia endosymbiont of Diaphorina citri]|jgi:hypothetical protein|uniref:hypothetical protein n=1 Tax=Wolbachia endosymbiont of Diaphorina citri TaxID=116598 RepID=UPI0002E681AF|nr:hypothetical protein [Wolbachia endosymbiont of Diaphorina citri]QJT94242.1 hypothetical protein HGO48_02030 [Wolbachia endosymbiont of Diaphorina citri]QJT95483.1 hypothetical protein HGO49_02030 [Wolbachia endosymbiont of Diaphorina citri]QJT96844.1 hypothetical protein HGO53_02740 [Wolbachia endosymbiont of Diaphorina citri]QLK11139.1 hypothetical protein FK497_02070 [Wolbachia endosymbiont of Diaphorina citri]QXY87329.1 hypothetical protein GZ064_05710 [Wolbachia endosymbiont of Diaphor
MFGMLKEGVADFTLKAKGLFASSESQIYVKDLRKVMTYTDGRKCKYPKNYDQIVKSGKVVESENSNGETIYKLLYGKKIFELALVEKTDDRSYFTIDFLVDREKNKDVKHCDGYYKPFGFSKIDLEKHIPIFEVDTQSLELTNSRVLAKKGSSLNDKGEVDEKDRDEKGRNGKLLYTSDYKKLNTHFSEIRDQNGNLELDKSLISVPIVFAAGLAKVCAKLLDYLLMKPVEYLLSKQSVIAKFPGYLLFTLVAAVKNLVNMGATILKALILLFVANEKKYGDAYLTMWKHQLKECWKEVKSDFNVVTNGERPKPKQKDHKPLSIAGTWKELNARRPDIEKELEEGLNKSSESIDKSRELGVGESLKEKLQNKTDEKVAAAVNQKSNTLHIDREIERRQDSSRNVGTSSLP